ncbi:MAG: RtcB family protein [bacterium]
MTEKFGKVERLDAFRWRLPRSYKDGMRVEGKIIAGEALMESICRDQAVEQVANVAFLPGIVGTSMAMPDIHWGYGFPIGGVAAMAVEDGVVSPGGVGYDINCGMRLLKSNLTLPDIEGRLESLIDALFQAVPSGVGEKGRIRLQERDLNRVLEQGARWAIREGYGWNEDLEFTEAGGALPSARAGEVSERAKTRGLGQLGTLGAGNHFLEVQVVEEIYDPVAAGAFGLFPGQITVMIHSGSRGLGHQVCTDFIERMNRAVNKYGIHLPDRQLCCAPIRSPEGEQYLAAMAAAANYAWANRQAIAHWTRGAFEKVFGLSAEKMGLSLVYDVAHNIAKIEEYEIEGKMKMLCVHRKGATRSFPPGHPEVPAAHRAVGQAVLVPGDMGRGSYILSGTEKAMQETFGSTCHGAGRLLSRGEAKRRTDSRELMARLRGQGIIVRSASLGTLAEEGPEAYKDVTGVVESAQGAGISRKVARMRPVAVMKG